MAFTPDRYVYRTPHWIQSNIHPGLNGTEKSVCRMRQFPNCNMPFAKHSKQCSENNNINFEGWRNCGCRSENKKSIWAIVCRHLFPANGQEWVFVCVWELTIDEGFATNRMQTFRHQQFRLPTNETDSKKWEMSFWVLHRMDHLRKQYHDAVFFSICQTISTNIIGREKKRRTWTSFQKVNMKKQRALNAQPKWTTKRMQWNSKNTLQRLFCFMIH